MDRFIHGMKIQPKTNILLVDDNHQNLLALEAILESPGYHLIKSRSGQEALKELLTEEVAVILLDVQMPSLDGYETARIIKQRERSKQIPIIFLTAISTDLELIFKGYEIGAVDYLLKPFHPEILKSKVAVFVDLFQKNRELVKEREERAAAEAVQGYLSFLVEASTALTTSLDYQVTLERVARLAVPRFADGCIVDMAEGETIRRVAVAHVDPAKEALAGELQRLYPPDPADPYGTANVLRTGQPELYPEISDALLEKSAKDRNHFRVLRGLGLKSAMIVPLVLRGRNLGAITFISDQSKRIYRQADLATAQDLARRAAFAVENARLYQEAQEAIHRKEESLALLDTLTTTAPVGLAFVDRNLRYARINQTLAGIMGLPPDEILHHTPREVVPDLAAKFEPIYHRVLQTGEPVVGVEICGETRAAPGEKRHWLASYYPVHIREELIGVGVVVVEMTERKRRERRTAAQYAVTRVLAESTALDNPYPPILQAICENLQWEIGLFWRVDRSARLLRCSEVWYRPSSDLTEFVKISRSKTFLPKEGLPGRVWASEEAAWIHDITQDTNFPRKKVAAKAGLHGAFAFPIRSGNEILGVIEFYSHEVRSPEAELLAVMGGVGSQIGQVIERKQAEKGLYESEVRKGAILESALDCIITMDEKGRIVEFNPAAERTFGYRQEDVIGKEMAQLIIPLSLREAHRRGLTYHLNKQEGPLLGKRVEIRAMRSDGTEFPVELAVTRIPLDGSPMFTGYLRDITERKRVEAELRQKTIEAEEASRLKSEFVSNVSHELRTPLNAIVGYTYLLLDDTYGPVGPEQKIPLEGVIRNAKDLIGLVNQVLDLSRIESGKLSLRVGPLSIHELIEETLSAMKPLFDEKSLSVEFKRGDPLPTIESDFDKIKQILVNLLSNAVKFTLQGGIQISTANFPDEEKVAVKIQDTGIGMKEEDLPKIFQAFHQVDATSTRAFGGVGLGLAIVHQLTTLLAGEIQVESRQGEGSTFTLLLPYKLKEKEKSDRDDGAPPDPPTSG